jgi:hypothetical protein
MKVTSTDSRLHLDFTRGSEFLCVVEGLPLAKLKKVSLGSGERIQDLSAEAYLNGVRVFLGAASRIEVLDLPSVVSQTFVLKLLTTQCEDLYQDMRQSSDEGRIDRGSLTNFIALGSLGKDI